MQGAYHVQRRLEWTDHPYRVYRESISHSTAPHASALFVSQRPFSSEACRGEWMV